MPKLTVEFNDAMNEVLTNLAEKKGLTKVDVLRRAVALYNYAEREAAQDKDVRLAITKDGATLKEIILT